MIDYGCVQKCRKMLKRIETYGEYFDDYEKQRGKTCISMKIKAILQKFLLGFYEFIGGYYDFKI